MKKVFNELILTMAAAATFLLAGCDNQDDRTESVCHIPEVHVTEVPMDAHTGVLFSELQQAHTITNNDISPNNLPGPTTFPCTFDAAVDRARLKKIKGTAHPTLNTRKKNTQKDTVQLRVLSGFLKVDITDY